MRTGKTGDTIEVVRRINDGKFFHVGEEVYSEKYIIKILHFFGNKKHLTIGVKRIGELGGGFSETLTIDELKEDYGC